MTWSGSATQPNRANPIAGAHLDLIPIFKAALTQPQPITAKRRAPSLGAIGGLIFKPRHSGARRRSIAHSAPARRLSSSPSPTATAKPRPTTPPAAPTAATSSLATLRGPSRQQSPSAIPNNRPGARFGAVHENEEDTGADFRLWQKASRFGELDDGFGALTFGFGTKTAPGGTWARNPSPNPKPDLPKPEGNCQTWKITPVSAKNRCTAPNRTLIRRIQGHERTPNRGTQPLIAPRTRDRVSPTHHPPLRMCAQRLAASVLNATKARRSDSQPSRQHLRAAKACRRGRAPQARRPGESRSAAHRASRSKLKHTVPTSCAHLPTKETPCNLLFCSTLTEPW